MLDDHDHDSDTRGEFSFVNYLSRLETDNNDIQSLASNDDLGLELSEPSGDHHFDLQSQSLESDAVIGRELACFDTKRETASDGPVDVSMAVQAASQSLGVSSTKPIWETGVWSQILGLQLFLTQGYCKTHLDAPS